MLKYSEIHLLIEQGVNTLGLFTEKQTLHEQIDYAFNHVVVREVNRILNTTTNQRNAIDLQFAKSLFDTEEFYLMEGDRVYHTGTPSSFLTDGRPEAQVVLVSKNCSKVVTTKESGFYIVKGETATYNGKNYSKDQVIRITDYTKLTYGNVELADTLVVPGLVVASEQFYRFKSIGMYTEPLVLLGKTDIQVSYSGGNSTPQAVIVNGLKLIPEDERLSWCKKRTINIDENLQHWLVDQVVVHLAIINEKTQQNVSNLKAESY